MFVLAKRKRKLWLFWTVPLISFITCILVLGYMLLSEGTQGKVRVEAFTVLDENSRRASTIGWVAVYTPMLGSDGLHFSPQTEVTYQNEDNYAMSYGYRRRRSGSALTIDWTRDQHLASGWQTPRVPSHFIVRKSETSRRERVAIAVGNDGKLEAVNGLGADITEFWYLDEKGNYYSASNIPAGGKAALSADSKPKNTENIKTLRNVYTREWFNICERMKTAGPELLTPKTYVALMDAVPFLDESATKGSATKIKSVIFGILKEGNDGG
jgi:hypothetical protein